VCLIVGDFPRRTREEPLDVPADQRQDPILMLPFLSDVLPFVLSPSSRHRNDASAAADVNVSRHGLELPAGLSIQWLGTASFAISYGGTTLITDPFASRQPLPTVARAKPLRSDIDAVARFIPKADAILVGHAHFDHALDIAPVVHRDKCPVYGSKSVGHLLHLHGLEDHARVVEPHAPIDIGPFKVTFVPSLHSKLFLGMAIPSGGELTCAHTEHLTSKAYNCGQVWGIRIEVAGTSLYHMGSCDLIESEIKEPCDIFLCGIAGRSFTQDFTSRILRCLQPKVIVPHHHDNFFLPLGGPMGFSLNVNYGAFLDEVRATSSDFEVRGLDSLQTVTG
jgi:L-ascorbate metabolism protein UlaG (beta-lactamase superfamily)